MSWLDRPLDHKRRQTLLHPAARQDPTDSVTGYTTQGQETREQASASSTAGSPGRPEKALVQSTLERRWGPANATPLLPPNPRGPGATCYKRRPLAGGLLASP